VKTPPKDILVKAVSVENFLSVSVNGNSAKVEARSIDGSVLDTFELTEALNKPVKEKQDHGPDYGHEKSGGVSFRIPAEPAANLSTEPAARHAKKAGDDESGGVPSGQKESGDQADDQPEYDVSNHAHSVYGSLASLKGRRDDRGFGVPTATAIFGGFLRRRFFGKLVTRLLGVAFRHEFTRLGSAVELAILVILLRAGIDPDHAFCSGIGDGRGIRWRAG